jgi:hypothetical protein
VKDPTRKAKRKPRKAPRIDDDLVQLAEVLAEYSLDNTAYGWFRLPWRNGRHAVALARQAASEVSGEISGKALFEIHEFLDEFVYLTDSAWIIDGTWASYKNEMYERAGQLYRGLIQPKIDTDPARLLSAALRCSQLYIANSHGGGSGYNEILIPAFLPIEPALVEKHVLEHRCRDAIGASSQLYGDAKDRERRAFTTAWQRGLYFAAYSIKAP